ncbi:MAG TPA: hypothetical protein VK674_06250 [Candidatus Limnocylindria bacterium]|nr:hypothetical protein [Candidatus Limnocylindria bacterium]
MEDDNQPDTTQDQAAPGHNPVPTRSGAVMDVQPPRPQSSSAGTPPARPGVASARPTMPGVSVTPAPSAPAPTPDLPTDLPDPADLAPTPPQEPASQSGLSPELLAQAQAETNPAAGKPSDGKNPLLAAHASHKSKGPKLVIAIAVVIALALAGVAVYAYMQSKKTDPPADHMDMNHTEEQTNQTTPSATNQEVEAAAKELDSTINTKDEAQELPDSDLSESSLGL